MLTAQQRRSYNLQILTALNSVIEMYPDLRFGQIIEVFAKDQNVDFFNEEPNSIYDRIIKKLNEFRR